MDWLTAWGVNNSIGFFFQEILIELSRDGASKYTQVLFKDYIDSNLELATRTNLQVVTGQLIKEFLALFQQELEDADLSDEELIAYLESIKAFIFNHDLQGILGKSLQSSNFAVDYSHLKQLWSDLELLELPADFAWTRISKRFCRRVKFIWQQINKPRSIDRLVNGISTVDIDLVETVNQNQYQLIKYKKLIQDYYGNLRLDSLDTSRAAYDELKLWRIFVAQNVREVREFIPQVYEIPKEHQKMLRDSGQLDEEELTLQELEEYNQFYSQQPLQSVLEVVADEEHKHIVILGDPGSGKSTLLQYIALQWTELPDKKLDNNPLPLLVELRTYNRDLKAAQCQNLLEFINSPSSIVSCLDITYIQDKLNTGKATILFDGLDEVFEPSQREQVITEIINFQQKYPEVSIIVTSRIIGYKQKTLAEKDFVHFMLQDLASSQVDDFINRWHDLTFYDRIDKERKRDRLKKAISESPAIQELSGNPLLLTMMAILNRNQELPRDRAELYNQSSRVLLHQWDTERALEDARLKPISLDYKDKQAMLRQVAYFMQANTQGLAGNSIISSDLKRLLSEYLATLSTTQDINPDDIAEVLIHQLRTRNFILCFLGAEYYAFVHRTFLEYFCAWEFVWQFEKARTIDIEGLKQVFGAHWQDESWHEVLRLITGMIDSKFAGEIIEFLMYLPTKSGEYGNLLMAAQCLSEVRNRTTIKSIDSKLLKCMQKVIASNFKLEQGDEFLYSIAVIWKDNENILAWFEKEIYNNKQYRTRANALQAIVKVFKNDYVLNIFKVSALIDKTITVRKLAMENIVEYWSDNSDVLYFLYTRAKEEKKFTVIYSIIKFLLTKKKNKKIAFEILRNCIEFNCYSDALAGGLDELIKNWKDHLEAYSIIKNNITSNQNWIVRYKTIEKLAEGWNEHPETYSIIKKSLITDDDKYVRYTAIKELIKGWKDEPETYNIIKKAAIYDSEYDIRGEAIIQLFFNWKHNLKTYELLCDRAVNDPVSKKYSLLNHNPRYLSLAIIIEQYPDFPEVLPLLRDRAINDPDERIRDFAQKQLEKLTEN